MSPVLILAGLSILMADKNEAKYQATLKKPGDSIEFRKEVKRTLFVITSKMGIGEGVVTLTEGRWPRDVVLRLQYDKERGFTMMEGFALRTQRIQITGSLRESGKMELTFLSSDGKAEGAAGHVNVTVQSRSGALEVTLPAHLLAGAKDVSISWIDAYRN
jgi:hypothetical protein